MQWGCVKTRPEELVDRQLRRWIGGRKHLGDPGHPQKVGRHGTGPVVHSGVEAEGRAGHWTWL